MWRRSLAHDPLGEASLGEALAQFVWGPLPTLIALAALIGVISGVSVSRILAVYNAESLALNALTDAMLRQVLPLIVGIFASGSVSVEIASRLGAMSLAQEIDALEAMGHDPVAHILGPPVVAVVAASPVHMAAASLAALIGAGIPLHLSSNISWVELAHFAFCDATAAALLVGMGKSLLFAVIAFAVGATVGSQPVRIPTEIGRRAGQAFTAGLLGIFVAATICAVLV
jgi:ABC-type transporter Mla maintaining outer membrane lipid asymmetry permease subunit MlaE